jgi:hypothetical protein
MKAYIITVISLGIALICAMSFAHTAHGSTISTMDGPRLANPEFVYLRPVNGSPTVVYVPEQVIVVTKAPKPKLTWTCGDWYTNGIGGTNRDCEWR